MLPQPPGKESRSVLSPQKEELDRHRAADSTGQSPFLSVISLS